MKQIKIKTIIPYFTTILAIITPWFFYRGYLFFTDFVGGPNMSLNWRENWFLTKLILRSVSWIFSPDFSQKLFIGVTLLVVLVGAKKLIEEVSAHWGGEENKIGQGMVFVLSLFALFNPFIYDRALYGQFGVIVAFGLLLWSMALWLSVVDRHSWRTAVKLGAAVGVMLMFSTHFIFFFAVLAVACSVKPIISRKIDVKKLLLTGVVVVVLSVVVNSNWLIGSAQTTANFVNGGISRQDLAAFQTAGKSGGEVTANVLMMSGFWGKDQFRYVDLTKLQEGWGRSFLVLLPIIIYGAYSLFKNKKTRVGAVSLIAVFLIATILAVGVRVSVARELTYWLFDHFPLYKGLRESQKWVSVLVVVYLFFLTIGTQRLARIKLIAENKIVCGVFLAAVIILQAPLLLRGFSGQVRPTQYPVDWQQANEHIVKDSECTKNILFLPWHMYMSFGWVGRVVATPAGSYFTCPVISGTAMEWGGIYDNSQDKRGEKIGNWLKAQGENQAELTDLKVGYIILAKEVDWKRYEWVGKIANLELVQDGDTLLVFKVK